MEDLVPTIDLSGWYRGDRDAVAAAVDAACDGAGFMQIVHHGIAEPLLDAMRTASARLFALPLEENLRSDRRIPASTAATRHGIARVQSRCPRCAA